MFLPPSQNLIIFCARFQAGCLRLEEALRRLECECKEAVDSSSLLLDGESEGEGVLLLLRGGDGLHLCPPLVAFSPRFFGGEGDLAYRQEGDLDPHLEDGDHPCHPQYSSSLLCASSQRSWGFLPQE